MDVIEGMNMAEEGLLRGLLESTPLKGLGITPQLTQRDIVVELTQEQLRDMLLRDADPRAKSSVTLELKEGRLILRIRLW